MLNAACAAALHLHFWRSGLVRRASALNPTGAFDLLVPLDIEMKPTPQDIFECWRSLQLAGGLSRGGCLMYWYECTFVKCSDISCPSVFWGLLLKRSCTPLNMPAFHLYIFALCLHFLYRDGKSVAWASHCCDTPPLKRTKVGIKLCICVKKRLSDYHLCPAIDAMNQMLNFRRLFETAPVARSGDPKRSIK